MPTRYGFNRDTGVQHTDACRDRIAKDILAKGTEADRKRVLRTRERIDEFTAERGERDMARSQATEGEKEEDRRLGVPLPGPHPPLEPSRASRCYRSCTPRRLSSGGARTDHAAHDRAIPWTAAALQSESS